MTRKILALALCGAALAGLAGSRLAAAEKEKPARPQVVGKWTGTWGIYVPPRPGQQAPPQPHPAAQMRLDCEVRELKNGRWEATFEGECGRPYKYTIRMPGRRAGSVVLFNGTADLGEKDGGVYDWIGRATEKEFVGFYTSQGYTGTFRLERPSAQASGK